MTETMQDPGTALVATNGAAALAAAAALGANFTTTSLEIDDVDLPYEHWENIGRMIGFVGNAWQWWVGDWLNWGETVYGEDAAQAVDDRPSRYDLARRITGKDQGYLQNIRSTCAKVAKERRRAELDFTHHIAVAALEPDDQSAWLDRGVVEQLSVSEMRTAIKQSRDPGAPVAEPEPPMPEVSRCERLEEVLTLILIQAQETPDGWLIPAEAMAQARALSDAE